MKRLIIICCLPFIVLLARLELSAQTMAIRCTFNNEDLVLDRNYFFDDIKDSIQFNTLKFYVGNVCLINHNNEIAYHSKDYQLIDWSDPATCFFPVTDLNVKETSSILFTIGVDSTTNAGGVLGGDLDPTKGMYWTWHTGYINFKLEGSSPICDTRNNEFVFHLGGFQAPYYAIQTVTYPLADSGQVHLELAVDQFLRHINLREQNHIMSPGFDALILSKKLANAFNISGN